MSFKMRSDDRRPMHRASGKRLSLVFLLIVGVTGGVGAVWLMMVSDQGVRLHGLMQMVRHSAQSSSGSQQNAAPASQAPGAHAVNRPFPQNLSYSRCIKPNNVTQTDINNSITSHYDYWKSTYVKESNGVTPGGGYYVFTKGTGGSGNEITTSEAHGYGMIVFALMAGYDNQAKQYFDGMFNMFDKHRSKNNPNNMSWVIDKSELRSKDQDSATDGDMDIAYALLLADHQWGSNGDIDYLSQARNIITKGVKAGAMSLETKRSLLGDSCDDH